MREARHYNSLISFKAFFYSRAMKTGTLRIPLTCRLLFG